MKRLLILCTLLIGISALPTSAILDTNQNQLSDLWERAFNGGNLFPPGFDLQADEDGDGWTNAEEEAAGTDPFDPNSPGGLLRPDITHIPESWADLNGDGIEEHTPEAIIISWPTIAGKQYSLLYSPDLADWLPVPGETLVGEGTILDYHITLTGDDRIFWRVAVTDIDSDGDGLTNAEEFVLRTDPHNAQTIAGIPDLWLATHFTNILLASGPSAIDPNGDPDGDGWTTLVEYQNGTDPNKSDTDGDGIPDNLDPQPNVPRGAPPEIISQSASDSQVVNLRAGEELTVLLTVNNPAGPPVATSDMVLFVNGTEASATFTKVAGNQFSFSWDAEIHASYPNEVLQSLAVRFRDSENATAWLSLGSCDVAEWEGEIAMSPILYGTSNEVGKSLEVVSHINSRRYADGFGNPYSASARFYRGPRNIAVRDSATHGTIATFQIPTNVDSPLFITRFSASAITLIQTIEAGDFMAFPHNSAFIFNNISGQVRFDWDGVVTNVAAHATGFQDYAEAWGSSPINLYWWLNGQMRALAETVWSHAQPFTYAFERRVFSAYAVDDSFTPRVVGFVVWSEIPASITPHQAGTLEFPGAPIHPFAIAKEGSLFVVPSGTYHEILYKVDPAAEQLTDGIKLHLGQTGGQTTPPQDGIGLYESTSSGLVPVALDTAGDILLSPTQNSTLYRKLTGSDGLPLFLKRTSTADQPHTLNIRLLSKYETNKETTIATVNLVAVDLDVNGNGYLDDSCDGLSTYLPGYEGTEAVLHTGDSFETVQYAGPQEMKLIIPGLGTGAVDAATFKILNPTSYFGYCGNAIAKGSTSEDEDINSGADFSFEAANDTREIEGTIEANQVWAPIFCKDYGAWCQVEITLKKNGTVIGGPIIMTLPLDNNGDKLADVWQDKQIGEWNDQFGASRPLTDFERNKMQPDATGKYPDDEEADSDGANNGDGGRDLPAMAAIGDGLTVLEEYRGFIFDGGPDTTAGQHKRLSIARKELLVECSVENELTSLDKNGAGTNQDVLSSFNFSSVMSDASSLYRDSARGVAIDLYWVKDALILPGPIVNYEDYFSARGGWEYNVNYEAGTYRVEYTKPGLSPVTVIGAGVTLHDRAWRLLSQAEHDDLYNAKKIGTVWFDAMQAANRNSNLEAFAKLSLPTRRGDLIGGISKDDQGQDIIDPAVFRFLKDEGDHSVGNDSGARIAVAALCDEGTASQWANTHDRPYFEWEFNPLLRQVVAHEIGHLIRPGGHYDAGAPHDTVMNGWPFYTDGRVVGNSTLHWDIEEIKTIKLPARSILR